MKEAVTNSLFFGLALSIISFLIGTYIKKRCRFFLFNPLLIAITITISTLVLLNIEYRSYNNGARFLSYLLTPATVALAIPLYEQLRLLRKNLTAILIGIILFNVSSFNLLFCIMLELFLNFKITSVEFLLICFIY